jgi:hypothetical protein
MEPGVPSVMEGHEGHRQGLRGCVVAWLRGSNAMQADA